MTSHDELFISELSLVLDIPVPCGHCKKEFTERASKLVSLDEIVCRNCGALLDLDTEQWAAFRDALKEFSVGKRAPLAPVKQDL